MESLVEVGMVKWAWFQDVSLQRMFRRVATANTVTMPIQLPCQYSCHANTVTMPIQLPFQYSCHANTVAMPIQLPCQYSRESGI